MVTSPVITMLVLGLIVVGLAISLPVTWLLVRLGHRARMLDTPGARGHVKTELRRVPNIGGIAIFLAIAVPTIVGLGLVWFMPESIWEGKLGLKAVADHLPRIRESTPTALALVGSLLALHVVGLIDDRKSLGPPLKFAVQFIAAATITIWFDVRLLTLVGEVPSIIITILWIVAITNAINFLDNMDGLAGGVSAIAATFFMMATILNAQWFIAGMLALLVGGLIGFLFFNFPPAKIFMGDGGSLVIGFLLAVLTARTTFYDPAQPEFALGGGWYGVFMPVIVLAIPLYDFITVSLLRISQGRSPFVGDQQHFSHRLVQRGLSKPAAVMVIWGLTAVTGIGGVSLGSLQGWQAVLVGAQTLLVLIIIALLEHVSQGVKR